MSIWVRDWVFRVVAPFLTQLKNRLGNISVDMVDGNRLVYTNGDNEKTIVKRESSFKIVVDGMVKDTRKAVLKLRQSDENNIFYGINGVFTFTGVYGSHVQSMSYHIATTHPGIIDVTQMNKNLYGASVDKVEFLINSRGSLIIAITPRGGSDSGQITKYNITFTGSYGRYEQEPTNEDDYTLLFDNEVNTAKSLDNISFVQNGADLTFTEANGDKLNFNTIASTSNLGVININSNFIDDKLDYENYVNGTTRKIVHDTVYPLQSGSLYIKENGGTIRGTVNYPLSYDREYRATLTVKSLYNGVKNPDEIVRTYVGIVCMDSDYRTISPQALTNRGYGVLAHDHTLDDTTVTITKDPNSADFYTGDTNHHRSLRFYDLQDDGTQRYIGENGRLYDDSGMSQWIAYYAYEADGLVDNGDGTFTITLRDGKTIRDFISEYTNSEPNMKAGSKVINCYGGNTYNYWISNYSAPTDGEWHTYTSPWRSQPENNPPENYSQVYRNGTAFVNLLVLPNYYGANNESWYGEIKLEWRHKQ